MFVVFLYMALKVFLEQPHFVSFPAQAFSILVVVTMVQVKKLVSLVDAAPTLVWQLVEKASVIERRHLAEWLCLSLLIFC